MIFVERLFPHPLEGTLTWGAIFISLIRDKFTIGFIKIDLHKVKTHKPQMVYIL